MVQIDEKAKGLSKARLASLFDAGTFVELSAYTKRQDGQAELESVVCGYGAVDGRLVFAFIQDSGRTKGAFGVSSSATARRRERYSWSMVPSLRHRAS